MSPFNKNFKIRKRNVVNVKAMDKLDKSKGKMRTLPDNLVRHQFLALLVKLASDKYVRSKEIVIFII